MNFLQNNLPDLLEDVQFNINTTYIVVPKDAPRHYARPLLEHFDMENPGRDKAEGPIFYRSASEGNVARLDFPGAVQNVYISSERRKDSPRGTTGSRPPSVSSDNAVLL
ncbi:hypothetical protein TNCV_3262711 [Trichonephila clavipes]|nr:hypothetical protein TNCV_3262711 [Trichonephila clavipes]